MTVEEFRVNFGEGKMERGKNKKFFGFSSPLPAGRFSPLSPFALRLRVL
jgi:hypothetical protein